MDSIKLKNSLIYYYGSPSGFVMEGTANIDSMFQCEGIVDWCKNKNYKTCFRNGIFESLVQKEDLSQFMKSEYELKSVRIWQLKADSDFSMRFIAFDEFEKQFGQPSAKDYEVVYDGKLPTNNLDEIYEMLNLNHPQAYKGHSLSMSDVIELYDSENSSFHYVDRFGFKEIAFPTQEQTQNFEVKLQEEIT